LAKGGASTPLGLSMVAPLPRRRRRGGGMRATASLLGSYSGKFENIRANFKMRTFFSQ